MTENNTTKVQPFEEDIQEEVIEKKSELLNNLENLPNGFEMLGNGNLLVKTKEGDFEIEEICWTDISAIRERLTAGGRKKVSDDKITLAIISKGLRNKKMGELELMKLKGSTVLKLLKASSILYNNDDFL